MSALLLLANHEADTSGGRQPSRLSSQQNHCVHCALLERASRRVSGEVAGDAQANHWAAVGGLVSWLLVSWLLVVLERLARLWRRYVLLPTGAAHAFLSLSAVQRGVLCHGRGRVPVLVVDNDNAHGPGLLAVVDLATLAAAPGEV